MTISVKHAFQSSKGDPADTTLVRPSNWNAEHTLTLATDKIVGRQTAGTGAAEEISCTSFGRSVIGCADAAAMQAVFGGFTTGDVKLTLKTTADSGWIMMDDGSIGDASSSATNRANADTSALFTLLWTNVSDTYAPVSGGRGASAAADFAAHKRITLTKVLGRALAVAGAGSGLTSRALGETAGAETHTLTEAQLPALTKTVSITDPGHYHSNGSSVTTAGGGFTSGNHPEPATPNTGTSSTGISATVSFGSGNSHNNIQPTSFLNVMVRL